MSEKILRALMRLFAIVAKSDDSSYDARSVVASFLKQQLNKEQVKQYLAVYDEFLKEQTIDGESEKRKRRLAVSSVKVIVICNQINEELNQKQKFIVLLNLIEFAYFKGEITGIEMEFLSTVASSFNLPENDFLQSLHLASINTTEDINDTSSFLVAADKKTEDKKQVKYLYTEHLSGGCIFLHISSLDIYLFRFLGETELYLNGQIITPGRIYLFSHGSSLRSSKINPIFYNEVARCFLADSIETRIVFEAQNITYSFKSGKTGLHELSFQETSGNLLGIMGGSGAGKSTLLNILNGNTPPETGKILINGLDVHNKHQLPAGIIGFVPQDDLLIEELTVYQNLFYNSKLCFGNYSDEQIHELVTEMLDDLGLTETAGLKVGNSLDKVISGGQRKRLNIALELIRKPAVLFVDEPTSGLSSRDSENIMDLLKELALKGKLVFVVIHQPSSDIFKLFDKLLILDNGGYPIYYGNPVEAIVYFKTQIGQVNANESQCITCGNVNPEQIFNIIELKVLDENGNQTKNRKITPKEWNELFKNFNAKDSVAPKAKLAYNSLSSVFVKPDFLKQLKVFITRDVLSKLSNTQYLVINLVEAPLLAFILAFLIKYYKNGGEYIFSQNKNLPAYLFMGVIVALFIGLTVSAEEIIRDRKLLKRESFLKLSRTGYLFSKTLILFSLSALQTFTFVLIGNYLMGIKGMFADYWLVLFSVSCFANVLGLNISSTFNSVVTIYILIPFLVIPQLILSGVIVKFEDLNPKISNHSVVPISGEIMASRWAFEALAVNQFMNNEYEKNIYSFEKEISLSGFKKVYWYFKMIETLDELKKNKTPEKFNLMKSEIIRENSVLPSVSFTGIENLKYENIDEPLINQLRQHIENVKKHYVAQYESSVKKKDEYLAGMDEEQHKKLLNNFHNKKLELLVRNIDSEMEVITEENGKLISYTDPVFRDGSPEHFIRAHFFAPRKNVFGNYINTYTINIIVIWVMSVFLWLCLYFDVLKKILDFFSRK